MPCGFWDILRATAMRCQGVRVELHFGCISSAVHHSETNLSYSICVHNDYCYFKAQFSCSFSGESCLYLGLKEKFNTEEFQSVPSGRRTGNDEHTHSVDLSISFTFKMN